MQLEDWLDDLCVRFIVNLPPEELVSVERICFQVEEAQWFYEDFIRPLDPSLPSLSLKAFSLRIFQHCPLFSTWSMHHYTSAFAEFLAYKQRVPVRGAIMLNEEMDEVVLVKGWKKGANWSFPRGKINKDENDLDCAIREVYEETGFDVKTAGLVKSEKDMKYIEVTMREQHMRLYVFRGVPKTTHFEPKTRKEISKIEWYKLTDLPTLKKKHGHQDTQDESVALSANKFYMVAPFLHPLKKWISQQKKRENRFSSSYLTLPPMTIDESATEGEPGPTTFSDYVPKLTSPQVPSSLPEVATASQQYQSQDPSSHLKEILRIGEAPQQTAPTFQPIHVPNADTAKSNALLSLLRSGSAREGYPNMQMPPEQTSSSQSRPPTIPQRYNDNFQHFDNVSQATPSLPMMQPQLADQQRSLLDIFANANPLAPRSQTQPSHLRPAYDMQRPIEQSMAPYQRTGDPEFSRDSPEDNRGPRVPPANALPKLTQHTRALLDAFKTAPQPEPQSSLPTPRNIQPSLAPNRQALLEAFKTPTTSQAKPATIASEGRSSPPILHTQPRSTIQPGSSNASSLLSLFKRSEDVLPTTQNQQQEPLQPPVELAAGPVASPKPQVGQHQAELLSTLLRKDAPKRPPQATRAGETAATIEGPLNQPHFESVARSPSQISADSMRRSPVPAHRTLFDPKQPTPTKILQRSEESKKQQTKSPRQTKANANLSSPKQKGQPKQEKPFQPQILKRPQNSDNRDNAIPSPTFVTTLEDIRKESSPLHPPVTASPVSIAMAPVSPTIPTEASRKPSHQTELQKQNLLSLLTGSNGPVNSTKPRQISTPTPGAISPLTQSQIVSPLTEEPPISTRSRMGSLVSVTNTSAVNETRPKGEKRQTAAGDKAFLLGYLGRIATQEGQTQ